MKRSDNSFYEFEGFQTWFGSLFVFMKKIILITLAILLLLSGCQKTSSNKDVKAIGEIIDGAGRKVTIKENNKDATIASVYAVAVPFLVSLKITDRVKAVNVKTNFWKNANEDLKNAESVGRGTVDLEKLASFSPTAFIHRSNDPKTVEAVEKLGIDVICITVENVEDVKYTLKILGEYFGVNDNANKTIEWIDKKFTYIKSIVDAIPMEERKTALLMGGELGRVAGSDMLQSWMIEKAGGIPVVKEGENHNWINIGVEKVFVYNPDVIFCTSSTSRNYSCEELIKDNAWSALKAIRNNNIFVVPAENDSWDMPGISCVLGTMYMLRKMYPNYFSIDDFEDQVDDYYRFMFGRCFDIELNLDWDNY